MLSDLIAALPAGVVVTDPDILASYRQDRAADPAAGTPLAVVRPTRTEEVQTVLRWATEHKVPVEPGDTPESLFARVQDVEKKYLPGDISDFVKARLALEKLSIGDCLEIWILAESQSSLNIPQSLRQEGHVVVGDVTDAEGVQKLCIQRAK